MSVTLGAMIAELSRMIDSAPANAARDPEALTWSRLAKVVEECGEVIEAYIGVTNQNPRKGKTHTMDDVAKELFDVAMTALAAYEHITGHKGQCIDEFVPFVFSRKARLGNYTRSEAT